MASRKDQGSIQKTLDALFSFNAAGVNWNSKYDNFLPVIEDCKYYGEHSAHFTGNPRYLDHFFYSLEIS